MRRLALLPPSMALIPMLLSTQKVTKPLSHTSYKQLKISLLYSYWFCIGKFKRHF